MKCKCGYVGRAEFGSFQSIDIPHLKVHMRCLKCKSSHKGPIYDGADEIECELRYPTQCTGFDLQTRHKPIDRIVTFLGDGSAGFIAYCITCPACEYGHASGIKPEEYEYLSDLRTQLHQG